MNKITFNTRKINSTKAPPQIIKHSNKINFARKLNQKI